MPSSLATTLLVAGAVCAGAGAPIAAFIMVGVALLIELVLFIAAGFGPNEPAP